MDQKPQPFPKDEVYAGPSPAVTALGYAKKYDLLGSLVGAIVGMIGANEFTRRMPGALTFVQKWASKVPLIGTWSGLNKLTVRVAGVLAGSSIVHYVGLSYGLIAKGIPHSHDGKNQFTRIKRERDEARAQVEVLMDVVGKSLPASAEKVAAQETDKKFADRVVPREAQGGYTAVREAEKQAAISQETARA